MNKIQAVQSFTKNKNSVISGDQDGNVLAQVEFYNMTKTDDENFEILTNDFKEACDLYNLDRNNKEAY